MFRNHGEAALAAPPNRRVSRRLTFNQGGLQQRRQFLGAVDTHSPQTRGHRARHARVRVFERHPGCDPQPLPNQSIRLRMRLGMRDLISVNPGCKQIVKAGAAEQRLNFRPL